MFVDEVKIFVQAGHGGNGACHFRREKFVPHGGPDGGDGGNGGSVIVQASDRLTTLLDFRFNQRYQAKNGGSGQKSNKHGKTAPNVLLPVPVGTIISDADTGEILGDLTQDSQSCVVAKGGLGGRGNANFATSTNRVPTHFEPGTEGIDRWLRFELKLLADVGLVGFPNVGKSTLISSVSSARPKIGDYPFTTLTPNLGVVGFGENQSFVVADIPGLIEGAHEGKGLGFQFLRHIERTSFLLHLVDMSEWSTIHPVTSLETMRRELEAFDVELAGRPFAVVGTKSDLVGNGVHRDELQSYCQTQHIPLFPISAVTRDGLDPLVHFVGQQVETLKRTKCATES